jgi:hypothetical protein
MFPFGVTLSLKAKEKDRLELSLSPGSRLILTFFFVLSCVVLLSSLPSSGSMTSNTIPFILFFFTGLSALYDEKWIFDRRENRLENRLGLITLCRKWSVPLDELVRLELDVFTKGKWGETEGAEEGPKPAVSQPPFHASSPAGLLGNPQRHRIIRLTVVDAQGKVHVLDSARAHRIEAFRRTGGKIAEFCGIPFHEN